jgi:hypothetical protein
MISEVTEFSVGDLVKESPIAADRQDDSKTLGIVTEIKRLGPNGPGTSSCQSLRVFWANYGEFWTTNLRVMRASNGD